jgi:hypothetical protein
MNYIPLATASGLSGVAGDDSAAKYFNSDYPEEFIRVPSPDYLLGVRALCDRYLMGFRNKFCLFT